MIVLHRHWQPNAMITIERLLFEMNCTCQANNMNLKWRLMLFFNGNGIIYGFLFAIALQPIHKILTCFTSKPIKSVLLSNEHRVHRIGSFFHLFSKWFVFKRPTSASCSVCVCVIINCLAVLLSLDRVCCTQFISHQMWYNLVKNNRTITSIHSEEQNTLHSSEFQSKNIHTVDFCVSTSEHVCVYSLAASLFVSIISLHSIRPNVLSAAEFSLPFFFFFNRRLWFRFCFCIPL